MVIDLQSANADLKDRERKAQQFEDRAVGYTLHKTAFGAVVYRRDGAHGNNEPEHYLCPNCYAQEAISIIQPTTTNPGQFREHYCHRCKAVFRL